MAKKNATPAQPVFLSATVAGQEHYAGPVTQTESGFAVTLRIPRKKARELIEIPHDRVIAALTGEEGFIVAKSVAVEVASLDVVADSRTAVEGGFQYSVESGELLFVSTATQVVTSSIVDEDEEAPAKKKAPAKAAPAKKGKKVEEEEEEEDEDEDDEDDEDEDEDEDDEDEDDEDDEDEVPAKGKKAPAKAAPAKGKKAPAKAPAKGKGKKGSDDDEFDF